MSAYEKRTFSEGRQIPFIFEGKELYLTKAKPKEGRRTQAYYCPIGEFYYVTQRSVTRMAIYFKHEREFKYKKNVHSLYPQLKNFIGTPSCHLVALETMVGERPEPIIIDGKFIKFQGDHINGNIFDCSLKNLRWVREDINHRDAGFLRKLRHNGIDPTAFDQAVLLAFFGKMALYKRLFGKHAYRTKLTKPKLLRLLVGRGFSYIPGQLQIDREMNRHCEF